MCFQDEKDFTLHVPLNAQNDRVNTAGRKGDIHPDRLFHRSNKFSLKLMVSCCVSYNGYSRPFFVNPQQTKVNGNNYTAHLQDELIPQCRLLFPQGNFIFVQDGAPSHTSKVCQDYLGTHVTSRFVDKKSWPPYSPDCNPLDYFFWNQLSKKVYENQRVPFHNLDVLKDRILEVWDEVSDLNTLRRAIDQFQPRLRAVVAVDGKCISHLFG